MTAPVVAFSTVTKQYGPTRALDAVSFDIRRGEMVALLGPNGAGKSTTVELLLGLTEATTGTVTVLGREPARSVRDGRVGAMLQGAGLPACALVGEVVDLARRLYGARHSLAELLEMAGLSDLPDRRVDRLSGGQARRVHLAIALAGDPEVLFFDEPTVGLDPEARRLFWRGVHQVAAAGATVMFATHYLDEVDANATRALVLAAGRLVADGDPASIKARLSERTVRATLSDVHVPELSCLPGVTDVAVDDLEVALRTHDVDLTLEALYQSSARVRHLRIEGASLEDALIELTTTASPQLERSLA
jgi:ABC-2 type transport system ATP-binding protein